MKHKILVIDDDESICNVFSRFLCGKGHEVVCASNGRKGLQVFDAEKPDLVVTDIMMPESDGLEVVMAIREREDRVPVIAISGGMRTLPIDFLPLAKKFGASKVLYKPVELEDLLAAIEEVMAP
ncbi:MAG: response regulator [Verrucomicrobiota bacterium]